MRRRRKSRAKSARPKGSYPLPTGGYVNETVHIGKSGKRIRVRGIRHDEPDITRIVNVLLDIAREQLKDQNEDGPKAA